MYHATLYVVGYSGVNCLEMYLLERERVKYIPIQTLNFALILPNIYFQKKICFQPPLFPVLIRIWRRENILNGWNIVNSGIPQMLKLIWHNILHSGKTTNFHRRINQGVINETCVIKYRAIEQKTKGPRGQFIDLLLVKLRSICWVVKLVC